jgi:hypothetical protein
VSRGDAGNRFGHTAHQQMVDPSTSVRSEDDKVRLPATRLCRQHHGHAIVDSIVADDGGLGVYAQWLCNRFAAVERRLPGLAQGIKNSFQIKCDRAGGREGEAGLLDRVNNPQLGMLILSEPCGLLDGLF